MGKLSGDLPILTICNLYLCIKKNNGSYDCSMLDYSNPLFRDPELLKLFDFYSLQILSFVYHCVSHITPDYFVDYYRMLIPSALDKQ